MLQDRVKSATRMGEEKERQAAEQALQKAIGELAAQFHPIYLVGLALEAHRNLPLYEMLVVSVNAAAPAAKRADTTRLAKLLSDPVAVVEAELRDRIRDELELKRPDGTIDPSRTGGASTRCPARACSTRSICRSSDPGVLSARRSHAAKTHYRCGRRSKVGKPSGI